jgi:hypothetical protein
LIFFSYPYGPFADLDSTIAKIAGRVGACTGL